MLIIYCLVDDILKNLEHIEDKKQKISDSEVITTASAATLLFG
jgi:hypothetical protein